jgi:hypothetical protein
MSQAQIQCPGCNRAFSPHGLSQHIIRSQCSSCCISGSNLASNATPWDHSAASSNELGLEPSTTQDGKVFKPCRRLLANVWNTDCLDLANNHTSPNEAAEAAEPNDFAAAAAAAFPNHEDTISAVNQEDAADPADAIDADLLETLSCDFHCSATNGPEHSTMPDKLPSVGSQSSNPVPPPPIHFEHGVSEGASQMIIDNFPHCSEGAPIPGADKAPHIYQSTQEAFGASIWAPFHSRCDWEIVCWAKMRGPSSSVVAELLAIPRVRAWLYCLCCY